MLTVDFPPRIIGGEGVFAGAIAERLAELGVELDVIAPRAQDAEQFDAHIGARVRRVPVASGNFVTRLLSFAPPAYRAIREFQGDVVYALRPVPLAPGRCLVSHFHTTRRGESRAAWQFGYPLAAAANALFAPFDFAMARRAALVLGVSPDMQRDLVCGSRPLPQFRVLPNGVDTARFGTPPAGRQPSGRLLYVGRLDPRKRVQDLLQAFARLLCTRQSIRLSIVGSGSESGRLHALASQLGVTDRVDFIPHLPHEQMPSVYRDHDVLVLPSAYEPFGLVILEAMACGTAAVTSRACAALGQPTFAVGDVEGLCDTLGVLLDDPGRLESNSREARRIALEHDWRVVALHLVQLFEEAQAHTQAGIGKAHRK
jgi:glycosyltransferase involved in cell wall biosynthesis